MDEKTTDTAIESAKDQLNHNHHNASSNEASQVLGAFNEDFQSRDQTWHKDTTRKLVRKIDRRLIPCLVVMYLMNFLDRSNLAQARQGSLEEDLGMSGTDFNLATSIFFVGYLLMQLPSNMLMTRVRPSIYLATAMVLWGVLSTCNAATHNFSGLVANRFFLGFVEAPLFPGAVFLMSSWYTRAELTRRVAWYYSGSSLANMFGGLLGYGILGSMDGALGIASWRWLFIIEGVVTIAIGICTAFILPDYPTTTRWLTEEERAFASWRLVADIHEADDQHATSTWGGLKLLLKDYRIYIFILLQNATILSQSFQYFFPSIVATLEFGKVLSLLLTVPVWFSTWLVSICVTWSSARTRDRSLHIICLMSVAAVGNVIATAATSTGARFFAMFLMPMGAVSSYQIVVSWVANSFPRPLVKRSAAIAICNMFGNLGNIYGSYMYPSSDEPRYIPGGTANACVCVIVALLALVLRFVLIRENKRLEQAENAEGGSEVPESTSAKAIDTPAHGFRYIF